jgi:SsrA-binding protein
MKAIVNRKAKFEYICLQQFEAGMVLLGTEVKSLKAGNANLSDAYCLFAKDRELILKSSFIAEYAHGNVNNHESRRDRKLLLRNTELKKLEKKVLEKGYTIIPYKFYFNARGFAKVEIWLAQGKKAYDKRQSIKEKDITREMDRRMADFK